MLVILLPLEFNVASEERSDTFRNEKNWNAMLRAVWEQCEKKEVKNIMLNWGAMFKNMPSKTVRKLKTCSFKCCLRWAKLTAHPTLAEKGGQKLTSDHCVGDWNALDFSCQMAMEESTQHNNIVLQPVWWKPSTMADGMKSHEQIFTLVNSLHKTMFWEEFFDTFFCLTQRTDV